jgi:2'-hydroxyisoflavone reductase
MRILVLGGTMFLGRHFVDAATSRGHEVTLFHRGRTGPDLFPHVRHIVGDRDGGLAGLQGGRWDAVVDTSGYLPRVVRASAELLKDAADHYTFVSSISVYADVAPLGIREDAPVAALSSPDSEDIAKDYGALKALCEDEVRAAFGARALVVRPGLIVGPHDPSDRFTYWPARIARGGEALAPGTPDRRIQFIDARDLASFMLALVEQKTGGTFNADSPAGHFTMGELLKACQDAAGPGAAALTWVPDAFLATENVGQWMELPLWIRDVPEQRGFYEVDISAAVAAGLTIRPARDTVRDTLAWQQTREPYQWSRTGLKPERERALLDRWTNAQR